MINLRASSQLLICGLCALFWELALIRWLGSNIRIIAYYSNFVLIAAFFGLGLGALLARNKFDLKRLIIPTISVGIAIGILFSSFIHINFESNEYVWIGDPLGLTETTGSAFSIFSHSIFMLLFAYFITAFVFVIFGQWIGQLFTVLNPLWAYSVEISGSILGILLFYVFSYFNLSPVYWFASGFILIFLIMNKNKYDISLAIFLSIITLTAVVYFDKNFIWSQYYRIYFDKIDKVVNLKTKNIDKFEDPIGYKLTVNNDYHQMILNLNKKNNEHPFLKSWRHTYDLPYVNMDQLPQGPILIVGAGTGNDVSAALRATDREIYAVEIDRTIFGLGEKFHFEKPYANKRVISVIDDARSFFQNTEQRFASVVFGFLDSHTLLSSYSSVRLDNFVYTVESFEQVKKLLLPGGKVYVTFASNRDWIHQRIVSMLNYVFDYQTEFFVEKSGYSNGTVYKNGRASGEPTNQKENKKINLKLSLATDDWPYLYLKERGLPINYVFFILVMVICAWHSMKVLPQNERKIKLPYFFLGAGFFLIETSNVISLSLLFGSTWNVNTVVFLGILVFVLLGNISISFKRGTTINQYFIALIASILLSIVIPKSILLSINPFLFRASLAALIYLGPVYFASLIFATLIKQEENLFQAYGSNVLGAVVGGACEYASLITGITSLSIFTLLFYGAFFFQIRKMNIIRAK